MPTIVSAACKSTIETLLRGLSNGKQIVLDHDNWQRASEVFCLGCIVKLGLSRQYVCGLRFFEMILFVNIQKQLGANADLMNINGSNRIDTLSAFYFGMDQTLARDHIHDGLRIIFEPTDDPQHCYFSMVKISLLSCCCSPSPKRLGRFQVMPVTSWNT